VPIPTLTVISGPPGAGKTTLAHALAERLGCPAICRDEIKEGMVLAAGPDFGPEDHDPLNWRTLEAFFAVLETLIRAEVSMVAEAAYQDRLWRPGLGPLLPWAKLLIIRCHVSVELARTRQQDRLANDPRRTAHADAAHLAILGNAPPGDGFDWPSLDVPALDLSTASDLATAVDTAAEFALTAGGTR
jgi:predicted kinase